MNADTDIVTVGEPMPRIASVRHAHDHIVSVTWAEGPRQGVMEEVDLTPVIMQYRVFQPLRGDIKLFASVQLVALHSGFDEFKRLGRGLGSGRDMHVPSSRVPDLW